MAKLLDESEAEGSALVVVRYGRPSAMVVPFEETAEVLKLPRLGDVAIGAPPPVEDDSGEDEAFENLRRSEIAPGVLRDIANPIDGRWTPGASDVPPLELNRVLVGLELDGLIERGPGTIRLLTRGGAGLGPAIRLDGVSTTAPSTLERPETEEAVRTDRPWIVVVWNDPINLMSYVTYVFQKLFGFPREKAHTLMLQVHYEGKALVASGPREKCEADVARLHAHGLWATLYKED